VWSGVLRVLGGNAGGLDIISHGNGGSILIKQNGSVRTLNGFKVATSELVIFKPSSFSSCSSTSVVNTK